MRGVANVYDVEGTVRTRFVRAADYARELGSGTTTSRAHATARDARAGVEAARVCTVTARYGPHRSAATLPAHARKTTTTTTARQQQRQRNVDGNGDDDRDDDDDDDVSAPSSSSTWTTVRALETVLPAQRVTTTTTTTTDAQAKTAATTSVADAADAVGGSDGVDKHNDGSDADALLRVAALTPASPSEVVQLLEHLQRRVRDEQARPRGVLCRAREAIMRDGMAEVWRQVTLRCPERGLLLRELDDDDTAATTATYDTLFEHACQYAARKCVERDLRRHLHDEKASLESEARQLDKRVNELRAKYAGMRRRFDEQRAATQQLHAGEVAYLKKAHQQIVSEIKRLTALEKASKSSSNNNSNSKS